MLVMFIRSVILYLVVVVALRVLGKRQIGELEPSELVVTILFSELVAVPMQDMGIPLIQGILPLLTIIAIELLLTFAMLKSMRFRALMCGKPSIIIQNGVIRQREMRSCRITINELTEDLRTKGITDMSKIRYGILETSGKLSLIMQAEENPVTAGQMALSPPETGLPTVLISDGRLMKKNLKARGFNEVWLQKTMAQNGLKHVRDVFFMTVDEQNGLYILRRDGT